MTQEKKSPRLLVLLAVVIVLGLTFFFALRNLRQEASPPPRPEVATPQAELLASPAAPKPTNIRRGIAASNVSTTEGVTVSHADKLKGAVEAMNVPVVFFGKVIDQDNAPLAGVKVRVRIRSWHVLLAADGDASFATQLATSGGDGSFQIDGGRGDALTIEAVEKEGYEPEPKALRSFGYTTSDPMRPDVNNPVMFQLWRAESKAQLVSGDKRFSLVPDGRTYTIDLLTGALTESTTTEGDLRVSIRRPENAAWGQRYDWTLDVQSVNGGLVEETDSQAAMFQAPEEGYTNTYRVDASGTDPNWSYGTGPKRFYLKSRGGKNYARIEIEAYAYYLQNKQGRFNVTYAVNPAGGRLLR